MPYKPTGAKRGRPRKNQPIEPEYIDPPIETQNTIIETRIPRLWPADKPLPEYHVKRRPMPCPACRRVYLDNGGQAVACMSSREDTAWFRCRDCGHRFEMPVK